MRALRLNRIGDLRPASPPRPENETKDFKPVFQEHHVHLDCRLEFPAQRQALSAKPSPTAPATPAGEGQAPTAQLRPSMHVQSHTSCLQMAPWGAGTRLSQGSSL